MLTVVRGKCIFITESIYSMEKPTSLWTREHQKQTYEL